MVTHVWVLQEWVISYREYLCELASSSHNIEACIKAVTFHSHSGDYLFNNKVYNFLPSMIADTYSNLVNE